MRLLQPDVYSSANAMGSISRRYWENGVSVMLYFEDIGYGLGVWLKWMEGGRAFARTGQFF